MLLPRPPLRRAAGLLFLLRLLLPAHSTTTTTSAPPVPTPRAADEDLPIAMPDRPPWDPSKLMKAEAAMHENLNSMLDGLPKFPFNTDALEANATSSLASSVDRDSSTPGEDEEGDDLDILDQSSVHSAVPPATATMTTSERPLLSPRQPARATPPAETAAGKVTKQRTAQQSANNLLWFLNKTEMYVDAGHTLVRLKHDRAREFLAQHFKSVAIYSEVVQFATFRPVSTVVRPSCDCSVIH